MAHGELAHEFDKAKWKPRLSLDAFLASGDQENNDGIQGSFNNLYGSNSGLYSRSQLFRGSNLRMLGPTMRVKPTDKLNIALSARQFWVDSDTDAWVDAGGNRLARDRTGRDSTGLGHEVAVNGTFELNKWTRLEAGVSATVPGAYAASFGRDDTYIFGYTGVSINF
jgi:hypothetical protein